MPQHRETSQDRPQVRLDPDVADWVREIAEDWSDASETKWSLGKAANALLRALRDEPEPEPVEHLPTVPEGMPAVAAFDEAEPREPPPLTLSRRQVRKGVNPRAAQILAWHRDGEV